MLVGFGLPVGLGFGPALVGDGLGDAVDDGAGDVGAGAGGATVDVAAGPAARLVGTFDVESAAESTSADAGSCVEEGPAGGGTVLAGPGLVDPIEPAGFVEPPEPVVSVASVQPSAEGVLANSESGTSGKTPALIASSRQLSPDHSATAPVARSVNAASAATTTARRRRRGARPDRRSVEGSKGMAHQRRGRGWRPRVRRSPGYGGTVPGETWITRKAHGFVEVADRVFVARYPQWDVNVGLVLGRDGAVVVDTRASDVQGSQVLDDVRSLGRDIQVRHVVNTHVHFDNTFGNAAFEVATVHAHDNVGRTIAADAERIKAAFRADPGAGPEYGYTERDAAEVMATVVRGPDRTFGGNATIDLGDRVVTMTYAGRGHTDGDVAVVVPDTDALFLGDLVEESAHPSFGGDSWPLEWADTLTSHLLQAEERSVVVPGHGRPVDLAFVARQRDDIAAVAAVIRERRLGGGSLEQALHDSDPRLPYPLGDLESAFRRGWEQLALPAP